MDTVEVPAAKEPVPLIVNVDCAVKPKLLAEVVIDAPVPIVTAAEAVTAEPNVSVPPLAFRMLTVCEAPRVIVPDAVNVSVEVPGVQTALLPFVVKLPPTESVEEFAVRLPQAARTMEPAVML